MVPKFSVGDRVVVRKGIDYYYSGKAGTVKVVKMSFDPFYIVTMDNPPPNCTDSLFSEFELREE